MNLTSIPRRLLRFEYWAARQPLAAVERGAVSRLGTETSARLAFDRAVGSLDAFAGRLIRDEELQRKGQARRKQAILLGKAAAVESVAVARLADGEQTLESAQADAARRRQEAAERRQAGVAEARREQSESKQRAQQLARSTADSSKDRADERAKTRLRAAGSAQQTEQERIRGREQAAAEEAKGKLREAKGDRDKAHDLRSDADRLDELAQTEREQRRASG